MDVKDVLAVHQEGSPGGQVELLEEIDQGGLPAAGVADERDGLARFGQEGDAAQHGLVRLIGEVDVAELDLAPRLGRTRAPGASRHSGSRSIKRK